jgi:hypothetical protein
MAAGKIRYQPHFRLTLRVDLTGKYNGAWRTTTTVISLPVLERAVLSLRRNGILSLFMQTTLVSAIKNVIFSVPGMNPLSVLLSIQDLT